MPLLSRIKRVFAPQRTRTRKEFKFPSRKWFMLFFLSLFGWKSYLWYCFHWLKWCVVLYLSRFLPSVIYSACSLQLCWAWYTIRLPAMKSIMRIWNEEFFMKENLEQKNINTNEKSRTNAREKMRPRKKKKREMQWVCGIQEIYCGCMPAGDLGFRPVQSINLLIMLILNLQQRRLSDWLTFLRG